MKKTDTFCDICNGKIEDSHWNDAPVKIQIKLEPPAQQYESRSFDDVCSKCRYGLIQEIDMYVTNRKCLKPAPSKGEGRE